MKGEPKLRTIILGSRDDSTSVTTARSGTPKIPIVSKLNLRTIRLSSMFSFSGGWERGG